MSDPKVHYSFGSGEPGPGFVAVVCGAHARTDNDLWSTDVQDAVTCGSCLRLIKPPAHTDGSE